MCMLWMCVMVRRQFAGVFPSTMWVLEIKLSASHLEGNAFTDKVHVYITSKSSYLTDSSLDTVNTIG